MNRMQNKTKYLLMATGFLCLLAAAVTYSRSKFVHHISSDGQEEFIYPTDAVALCRHGIPTFALAVARWEGFPDYRDRTGDIIANLLVARVDAFALDKKR